MKIEVGTIGNHGLDVRKHVELVLNLECVLVKINHAKGRTMNTTFVWRGRVVQVEILFRLSLA